MFYAPEEDCDSLKAQFPDAKVRPTPNFGIAKKRQVILEESSRVLMVDDDITIAETRWCEEKKQVRMGVSLTPDTPDLWDRLIGDFQQSLNSGLGMAGIIYGAQSWSLPKPVWESGLQGPTRLWGIYAMEAPIARMFRIRFDALQLMEDFDVNLQMLRSGVGTAALTRFSFTQKQSNAEGGCSNYRTFELQKECAEGLASRHKGFVKVVRKNSGWGNGLESRYDTRVSWAKAAKSGACEPTPRI